jgi:hypothetical protein
VLDLLSKQLVQASSFIFYTTLIFEVVGIVGLLITFDRLWKKTPIIIQIISIILIVMLISLIFTIYLIFSFHPQFG